MDSFDKWKLEAATVAKQKLNVEDVDFLIGDSDDMRDSFFLGLTPQEYVDEQISALED